MKNVQFFKTKKEAMQVTGSLSKTSKMPGLSYGIPAKECKTGSKLRKVKGSVCSKCYAMKGCYAWGNVQAGLQKRLESITNPAWVGAMVKQIEGQDYFRWHDSGDLQSMQHLKKIVEVAEALPSTYFWLPTKEKGIVNKYLRNVGQFPPNLIVRVSAAMIGSYAGSETTNYYHSAVVRSEEQAQGYVCPSSKQGNKCGDCRACWSSIIKTVTYLQH